METKTQETETLFEPNTSANQRLRDNVAPTSRQNPAPAGRYNLVVVGAGTGGLVTAAAAAGLGGRVALIERHALGGDCLNVGCVPSKALLAVAKQVAQARSAGAYGVKIGGPVEVDFGAVMERMRELRAKISANDSVERFSKLGVEVFLGEARFKNRETVEVGGAELRFAKAVVATGARGVLPPIPGLQDARPLTNESVFSLTELPERLVVIGGGPIGCELAQAFARFGSRVTLLDAGERILLNDEAEAADEVENALRDSGVDIVSNVSIKHVSTVDGCSTVAYEREGGSHSIECERILVGAGRAPNVQGLGLEAAGVEFDERKGVEVDDRLRTSNARIYAVGDVCMAFKFTHAADAAARIVVQNALFHGRKKLSDLTMPWCTYTDPELAHVGLSEAQARERHGSAIAVYRQDFDEVDRSILEGKTDGFVKVVALKGKILGATIVGVGAGDLISEISVAMAAGAKLGTIAATIHPYPTTAEAIRKIGDASMRGRLTPTVKKLFTKWLAWSR